MNGGDPERAGEAREHLQHRVAGHQVAGKSDRVAERPHEVGDDLDHREHDPERHRRRARHPEELQEVRAVLVEADRRDGDEDREREDRRDGDVRGRREARRDQRQHVGEEDEQEERHDVGEVLGAFLARRRPRSSCGRSRRSTRRPTAPRDGTSARPREPADHQQADRERRSAPSRAWRWWACTSAPRSPPNSGCTSNWSIGWMLKPLPPCSASSSIGPSLRRPDRSGPSSRRASARPRRARAAPRRRCGASCARPPAKPSSANTTRNTGPGAEQRVQPVADREPEQHPHHQLGHHPPGERALGELAPVPAAAGSARPAWAAAIRSSRRFSRSEKGSSAIGPPSPPGRTVPAPALTWARVVAESRPRVKRKAAGAVSGLSDLLSCCRLRFRRPRGDTLNRMVDFCRSRAQERRMPAAEAAIST